MPEDDPTIPDSEQLFRRVIPRSAALVAVGDGTFRPAGGALRDKGPLSVDLSSLSTLEETKDRDQSQPFHVASVSVAAVRAAGCVVQRDPLDDNPAHAVIFGHHSTGGLTGGESRKIAQAASIALLNPLAAYPNQDPG
jgi:hypothetical protein